ncbi:MAG TPA: hypothetical protein VGN44_14415 [Candidatus Angelobacter sp.]|jgi:uncharacterized membrane protein
MNKGELILAAGGTALQVCLGLLLLIRRSYRQFPVFCVYVGFSVLSAAVTFLVRQHAFVLLYVFWVSEALYVLLTFLVLQEVFRSVFRNFYALRWFKLSFPSIGILMIVLAILRQIFLHPVERKPIIGTLISLEIAVGFLQFGIFCLFVLLVRFFHMQWRQRAFGIVLGFGIVSAGSLVAFILRSEFGKNFDQMVNIAAPLSYIIGVVVWLATFLREEPSQLMASWDSNLTPEQMIAELKRHTQTVKGILGR